MECNFIRSRFVYQLPPGARVSKDCRDLLLRLLERNPDARITFAEFFTHPFVDLEHMSSAESLTKAVREQRAGAAHRSSRWPWVICGVTDWAHAHMWLHVCAHVCFHAWLGQACTANRELQRFAFEWRLFSLFQKEMVLQAVQKDQEGQRSAALSLYCGALEHFVPAIHCKSSKHSLSHPVFGFSHFTIPHRCPSAINWQNERSKSKTKTSLCAPQMRPTGSGRKPSGRR